MLLNGFHFKTEEIDLLLYLLLQQDGFYGYSLIGTLFFPCWQQYSKLNSHLFCISINVKPGEWFPDLAPRAEFGSLSPSASHLRSWGGWWWGIKKRRAFLWAHGWGMGRRKETASMSVLEMGEDKAECKHINCLFGEWHNCKNVSQVLAAEVFDLIISAWNLAKYHPTCFNEWVKLCHSEENLLPFHFAAMCRKT